MPVADMDQGLKRLLTVRPADILTLAFPGIEYQSDLPTDVATEPQLALDTLFRARYEGVECAVNVEVQAYRDDEMPRRCFEYGARASVVHQLPVLSVVLWLLRRGNIPPTPYEMRIGSWVQATWQIVNIEVYNLDARDIIAAGLPGLLPLVPFMRGGDTEAIEQAGQALKEQEVQAPQSHAEWGDLVSLLAVFTARMRGEEAARALIRSMYMSTEFLEESPLYRAWRAEAREQGLEQGKELGLEEGLEQGKLDGLRLAVRAALEGRFGTLPESLLALIAAANEATLTAVLTHIATDTLEQVQARLSPSEESQEESH
jgi:predicted transposase YdaD